MKKLVRLVCAFAVIAGAFYTAPTVGAQAAPCDGVQVIRNTGEGSTNVVTCISSSDLHVTCVNNAYALDATSQTAVSGNAASNGGSAITGNATNTSGTVVAIGSSCAATTTETTTPTTPTTTPAAASTPATAVAATKVAALPYTAGNNSATIVVATIVGTTILFVASRLGLAAYRRTNQR